MTNTTDEKHILDNILKAFGAYIREHDSFDIVYPKYLLMYIRAFERMLDERKCRGFPCGWETAEDVYHWWMEDGLIAGQLSFDDLPKTAEATPPIRVPEPTAAEDAA